MVYPIQLDDKWNAGSRLPLANKEPVDVEVKAIYEIEPTPESARYKVWTGRAESAQYHFEFWRLSN